MESLIVLVIEDNPINMKLVRSLLKIGGYHCLEAEDAATGIELARTHKPALILMDLQLPGMDGLTATGLIKQDPTLKQIPVIALTAHAMRGDDAKALAAGCSAYIRKPIDTRRFLETIAPFVQREGEDAPVAVPAARVFRPRILIVDDMPVNVKVLAAKLPQTQFEVLKAYGGEEAIEVARQQAPDLILLDYMMPEVDGYQVTKSLKTDPETRDIPIVIITALDGTEEKLNVLEAGAEDFLNKPVNHVELLARVNSLLLMKQYKEQLSLRRESAGLSVWRDGGDELATVADDFPTILIVEDGERDARLLEGCLHGMPVRVLQAKSGQEALQYAKKRQVDLVILDILLPDIDGFDVCRQIKQDSRTEDIQIVMVTCLRDLENRIKGIEMGVDDYLIKPVQSRELLARIKTLLKKKFYLNRLQLHLEAAMTTAILDGLTGLYNHSYLRRFLDLELKKSERHRYPVALLMVDIDDFKVCNDTFGHVAGDQVLKEVAQVLQGVLRDTDLASRYGGEEFAVVLPYCDKQNAEHVAQRILQNMAAHPFPEEVDQFQGTVTVSIGAATYPEDAATPEELIRSADRMLYAAKGAGKNRVCLHPYESVRS